MKIDLEDKIWVYDKLWWSSSLPIVLEFFSQKYIVLHVLSVHPLSKLLLIKYRFSIGKYTPSKH